MTAGVATGQRAWVEQIMGMPVSIHLRGADLRCAAVEEVVEAAFAELRRADALFSLWQRGSEVRRIRRGELLLADSDPLVQEVASWCRQATERTHRAFTCELPDEDGTRRWDPTGLVKGWAVERAAAVLDRLEGYAHSVNAGGDIALGGHDASGPARPWRIGIEDPRDRSRIAEVVEMVRGGVATSGTAARGAHLWDPERQEWVRRIGSVTVVGPSLLWADIWATALFVGPPGLVQELPRLEPDYRAIVL